MLYELHTGSGLTTYGDSSQEPMTKNQSQSSQINRGGQFKYVSHAVYFKTNGVIWKGIWGLFIFTVAEALAGKEGYPDKAAL